jgi:hypothetical protein
VRLRVGELLKPQRDIAQAGQDADAAAGAKAESAELIAGLLPVALAQGRSVEDLERLLRAAAAAEAVILDKRMQASKARNAGELELLKAQGDIMHRNIDTIGTKVIVVVGLVVLGGLEVAVVWSSAHAHATLIKVPVTIIEGWIVSGAVLGGVVKGAKAIAVRRANRKSVASGDEKSAEVPASGETAQKAIENKNT